MQQVNGHSYAGRSADIDLRTSPTTDTESVNTDVKNKPGAKPRASRAGTRSVSTLNAEQLARKRANDREAQRAIRQRTREHIDRLENRIKELSENNPESDAAALEAVQRRNAELEEELRQLRKTLFGLTEGSNSPAASHQHPVYIPNSRSQVNPAPYSPQSSWVQQNAHMGFQGIPPTSNPVPDADPSWQPHVPIQHSRRSLPHQQLPGFHQPIPWSRNESSDSDYDSGYGHEPEHTGGPIGAYPEQMHSYLMQNSQVSRPGVMWQTPTSSSGSSTPFEAQQQLPNMPHLPTIPTTRSDDPRMYAMKQPHHSHSGMPTNWGPPSPHGSDF